MSSKEKIEINKKMIGKEVIVVDKQSFRATVIDVADELNLVVKKNDSRKIITVNLFDVRSVDYQNV